MANGDEANTSKTTNTPDPNSTNNNAVQTPENDEKPPLEESIETRKPIEHTKPALQLDLGDESAHSSSTTNNNANPSNLNGTGNHHFLETATPGPSSAGNEVVTNSKLREDNPISFKRFLQDPNEIVINNCSNSNNNNNQSSCGVNNNNNSYQNKGARPKLYNTADDWPRSISDFELPINNNNNNNCHTSPNVNNTDSTHNNNNNGKRFRDGTSLDYSTTLPDFVQDHLIMEQCYLGNSSSSTFNLDLNLPDFTPSSDSVKINRLRCDDVTCFPLDLPHNDSPAAPTLLPDFLVDGGAALPPPPPLAGTPNGAEVVESTAPTCCNRLQRELELVRRHLCEQIRQNQIVNRELEVAQAHRDDHDVVHGLQGALHQAEHNLKQCNEDRVKAEQQVARLKEQVKALAFEVQVLKDENRTLRSDEGAAGGGGTTNYYTFNELQRSHRLAQDLKAAANTAEYSLRQLLSGVDNLRMMATTLDNLQRIDKDSSYLESDEDSEH